jgi:SAM-dependent methyltransferase
LFNENVIFSKWVADMYDQKVTETQDVDLLLSEINRMPGYSTNNTPKQILEVCCGSGRILIPLAKANYKAKGFDADGFMLSKIRAKAEGLGNIQWSSADAVRDDWGNGFDVVVLFGNILYNIISEMDYEKAQELFIQKAASALVPGGYACIDYQPGGHLLMRPDYIPPDTGDLLVWEGADSEGNYGRMILLAGDYEKEARLNRFTRRFELTLKNGDTIAQDIPCEKHFATLEQIRGWLAVAGFEIEREYGDYDRSPISENSIRAIIIARKGVR